MTPREYATALVERATKTAAQGALLGIGSDSLQANALTFDWLSILGFALGGFVLSLLTSVATSGFGNSGPAAFGPEVVAPEAADLEPALSLGEDEEPHEDPAL